MLQKILKVTLTPYGPTQSKVSYFHLITTARERGNSESMGERWEFSPMFRSSCKNPA